MELIRPIFGYKSIKKRKEIKNKENSYTFIGMFEFKLNKVTHTKACIITFSIKPLTS